MTGIHPLSVLDRGKVFIFLERCPSQKGHVFTEEMTLFERCPSQKGQVLTEEKTIFERCPS